MKKIVKKRREQNKIVRKRKPFIIYLITSPSGKQYIGQTMRGIKVRWIEHYTSTKNTILVKAIKKYGYENFTIICLERTYNKDKANQLEKFYIEKLNTFFPNGYNMSSAGGGGIPGIKRSGLVKKVLSKNKTEFYKNKNNRKEQSIRMQNTYSTVQGKKMQTERAFLQNKPEIKEKTKEKLKKLRSTEEYKNNKSIEQRAVWGNKELKEKHSEIIKKTYLNGRVVWNKGKKLEPRSEETKKKLSEKLIEYYKNKKDGHC